MLWGQPIKVLMDHKNLMRGALGLTSDRDNRWRLLLEKAYTTPVQMQSHDLSMTPMAIQQLKVILRQKSTET